MEHSFTGYIGTNFTRGIYKIKVAPVPAESEILSTTPFYNSGHMITRGNLLYSVVEGNTFQGLAEGGIETYDISGDVPVISGSCGAGGQRTCFIFLNEEDRQIYTANFIGGNIGIIKTDENYIPVSLEKKIETSLADSMIHCVGKLKNLPYLMAVDAITDRILVYDVKDNFKPVSEKIFPQQSFPRHIAFSHSKNYIYVVFQAAKKIGVYMLDNNGILNDIQELATSSFPETFFAPSAIKLNSSGTLLSVCNRGGFDPESFSTVSLFSVNENGSLSFEDEVKTIGRGPRDSEFTPENDGIIACMQQSDCLEYISIDKKANKLTTRGTFLNIPSPASIALQDIFK